MQLSNTATARVVLNSAPITDSVINITKSKPNGTNSNAKWCWKALNPYVKRCLEGLTVEVKFS